MTLIRCRFNIRKIATRWRLSEKSTRDQAKRFAIHYLNYLERRGLIGPADWEKFPSTPKKIEYLDRPCPLCGQRLNIPTTSGVSGLCSTCGLPLCTAMVKAPGEKKKNVGLRVVEAEMPKTLEQSYAVLGLKPNTPFDEARTTFIRKIKLCHPDVIANPALKAMADYHTKRINNAWEIIREKGRRAA